MQNKPRVKLIGKDGNAYAILGACDRAAREANWTQEEIDKFVNEATSGDYNHLLRVCQEYFKVY